MGDNSSFMSLKDFKGISKLQANKRFSAAVIQLPAPSSLPTEATGRPRPLDLVTGGPGGGASLQ